VHDALCAVTGEAAFSWRMEAELGSITAGKAANFTVLAEDPSDVDPARLNEIAVLGSVYGGRWFPVSSPG
jgi:predicted amidohydrolase YtcJ